MSLLDKWLQKKDLKLEELTDEERAVYDSYKTTLTGKKELKIDDIERFCESQVELIQDKFGSPDDKYDSYLKASAHIYITLLKAIRAPKVERERLEKYLIALISTQ